MTFTDRLAAVMKEKDITQSELARRCGVTRQTVNGWVKGRIRPRDGQKVAICELFAVSPAWLFYGNQPGQRGDSGPLPDGSVAIPLYDAPASCGGGYPAGQFPELLRMIEVQPSWLQAYAPGASKNSLSMIQVVGDSMAPTLIDGDYVIVDSSQTAVTADALYAIDYAASRFVKRLQVTPKGLIIISDNPKYRPIDVAFDEDAVRIIGRAYAYLKFGRL